MASSLITEARSAISRRQDPMDIYGTGVFLTIMLGQIMGLMFITGIMGWTLLGSRYVLIRARECGIRWIMFVQPMFIVRGWGCVVLVD